VTRVVEMHAGGSRLADALVTQDSRTGVAKWEWSPGSQSRYSLWVVPIPPPMAWPDAPGATHLVGLLIPRGAMYPMIAGKSGGLHARYVVEKLMPWAGRGTNDGHLNEDVAFVTLLVAAALERVAIGIETDWLASALGQEASVREKAGA
jgi:hypothetical protein